MTRNMGYGEFSDFYFSRQPKYGHSKNVLKYPPIGAILRGVLQQPPEGGWDQTKYGHGHTPWVLDQPWYQNRVTRFGHFPLGFEGLANEHLRFGGKKVKKKLAPDFRPHILPNKTLEKIRKTIPV